MIKSCIRLYGDINEKKFTQSLTDLVNTKYERSINQNYAPNITNCVTFVRYMIENSINGCTIPKDWIGNLPRRIIDEGLGQYINIDKSYKKGDLIFMKKKKLSDKFGISHCGIYVGNNIIAHSSSRMQILSKINDILEIYDIVSENKLKNNIDYRTNNESLNGKP